MALIVQKFGGSSVADTARIRNVARIITETYRKGNNVVVVLSAQGDTTDDLIAKAEEINPGASRREMDMLLAIADGLVGKIALPCTACRYCVSHCPQGLDIPFLLSLYNEHCFTGGGFIAPMALASVPEDKQPGACIGCRSCEAVCPQQIKISEAMADFSEKLNG